MKDKKNAASMYQLSIKRAANPDKWEQTLLEKVTKCRFFALHAFRSIAASEWVNRKVQRFFEGAYSSDNRWKSSLEADFEAFVEVQYSYDVEGRDAGDRRRLIATEPVRVEAMVEIPRLA